MSKYQIVSGRVPTVRRIADAFALAMGDYVTFKQLLEIDARNAAEKSPNICHSHDFCDANVPMADAFDKLRLWNPCDERHSETSRDRAYMMWNAAWDSVKVDGFCRSLFGAADVETVLGWSRAAKIAFLEWNDQDGCYSDEDQIAEYGRPMTDVDMDAIIRSAFCGE